MRKRNTELMKEALCEKDSVKNWWSHPTMGISWPKKEERCWGFMSWLCGRPGGFGGSSEGPAVFRAGTLELAFYGRISLAGGFQATSVSLEIIPWMLPILETEFSSTSCGSRPRNEAMRSNSPGITCASTQLVMVLSF